MLNNMLHNNLYSILIFKYNQEYNKINLLHNIKYTKSEHNTYTFKKFISRVCYITSYIVEKTTLYYIHNMNNKTVIVM